MASIRTIAVGVCVVVFAHILNKLTTDHFNLEEAIVRLLYGSNQLPPELNPAINYDLAHSFDQQEVNDYCNSERGEWEPLNNQFFLKKSGIFYFVDTSTFLVLLVAHVRASSDENFMNNIKFNLEISVDGQHVIPLQVTGSPHLTHRSLLYHISNYDFTVMSFKLDINEVLSARGLATRVEWSDDVPELSEHLASRIQIKITSVEDGQQRFRTKRPLDARVKTLRANHTQHEAMICSKCYQLSSAQHRAGLAWWFDLNKRVGYHKVALCNNSIENEARMNAVFEQHKDFVQVQQLRCVPDLFEADNASSEVSYFREFPKMSVDNKFLVHFRVIFEKLFMNECFMSHSDKYRYIAVLDYDETVLPRLSSRMWGTNYYQYVSEFRTNATPEETSQMLINEDKCDRFSHSSKSGGNSGNNLIDYLNVLNNNRRIHDKPTTFYFFQSYYLKNAVVKRIFAALEQFFEQHQTFSFDMSQHEYYFRVIDDMPESDEHVPYNYTFTIANEVELAYARSLLKLNKEAIQPFIENMQLSGKAAEYTDEHFSFNRFYMIMPQRPNDLSYGKLIHHTLNSYLLLHHGAVDAPVTNIWYDQGSLSHFRVWYRFQPEPMAITQLYLDLNYLNCYFRPIMADYAAKEKRAFYF